MTSPDSNENTSPGGGTVGGEAPGQERTAEAAADDSGHNESLVVTDRAPLAEPQHSADEATEGALTDVQERQTAADERGHFGTRVDPRPLEDYSVQGSVARAEAGDDTALPRVEQ